MNFRLSWNCDFCGKAGLITALDRTIYCQYCRMTYGKTIKSKGLNLTIKNENNT